MPRLDRATRDKITMRHCPPEDLPRIAPVTGAQIRLMRSRAKMSQAVFASHLNVTTGYLSQLERGAKRPTGAAAGAVEHHQAQGDRGDFVRARTGADMTRQQ